MRILVIGAGALGGYFGARLAAAGRDVTFLVRPARAKLLKHGLHVSSPAGDVTIAAPQLVTASEITAPFDLILLSCKAYDLDDAMASFAPAMGPHSAIIPVLNGMAHIDALRNRFGRERVLGGLCQISATLDDSGRIRHLNDTHSLTFGELGGGSTERSRTIARALSGANFDLHASDAILQDMWEKWVFIASLAGITCLMRASVGDIVAAGAGDLSLALLEECASIAETNGYPPRPAALQRLREIMASAGSPLMASMLRDLERGSRTEADHVLGDLMRRGDESAGKASLLRIAHAHLKANDARRLRETT